jgi:hypothetical protein
MYLFKNRLAIEITESIYVLTDKGEKITNFKGIDILKK